jgi:hypothetical protein
VRLSRHAKNGLRSLGASLADIDRVISDPVLVDWDDKGRIRYTGYIGNARVRIVVARDVPDLIVTIHDRRK